MPRDIWLSTLWAWCYVEQAGYAEYDDYLQREIVR